MNLIPQSQDMQVLTTIAKTAHVSGLYNTVGGEAKILMILLAAQDLGIKPTIALNGGIWNIQGKIEISARLMTSMIRRAGHSISIKECNDKICTLKGKRADNGDELESSFSIEDATKAGLAGRDVWKKYAEDMLYSRAMSRLARRLFPDVIGTAYVEGEIRESPENMKPTDVVVTDCAPEPKEDNGPGIIGTPLTICISKEMAEQLVALSEECDPEYVAKVLDYLSIDSFYKVRHDLFARVHIGLKKNADSYTKKVVNV